MSHGDIKSRAASTAKGLRKKSFTLSKKARFLLPMSEEAVAQNDDGLRSYMESKNFGSRPI